MNKDLLVNMIYVIVNIDNGEPIYYCKTYEIAEKWINNDEDYGIYEIKEFIKYKY